LCAVRRAEGHIDRQHLLQLLVAGASLVIFPLFHIPRQLVALWEIFKCHLKSCDNSRRTKQELVLLLLKLQ